MSAAFADWPRSAAQCTCNSAENIQEQYIKAKMHADLKLQLLGVEGVGANIDVPLKVLKGSLTNQSCFNGRRKFSVSGTVSETFTGFYISP